MFGLRTQKKAEIIPITSQNTKMRKYAPDPDNAGGGIGVMEFNCTVGTPAYSWFNEKSY
ncbi:hypothetical protein CLV32_2499 [Pedobacter duraquae]|uniref:Uncharacterized protein n=1 Tax=Pedobacter duraquae TaxID=425511 RepID=A0A4R6IGY9_9SPHI|nr:hypothetical protein CLV32_2499 [Pedobacter duraquae]